MTRIGQNQYNNDHRTHYTDQRTHYTDQRTHNTDQRTYNTNQRTYNIKKIKKIYIVHHTLDDFLRACAIVVGLLVCVYAMVDAFVHLASVSIDLHGLVFIDSLFINPLDSVMTTTQICGG